MELRQLALSPIVLLKKFELTTLPSSLTYTKEVIVSLAVPSLIGVNKYQSEQTSLYPLQEWTNQLVKWNPADFGGLEQVTIDSSQIWQPDIVLYNK